MKNRFGKIGESIYLIYQGVIAIEGGGTLSLHPLNDFTRVSKPIGYGCKTDSIHPNNSLVTDVKLTPYGCKT